MRAPTKNDIEMQRIRSGARKFTAVCDVIKTLMKSGTFIVLVVCCYMSLKKMIDADVDEMELFVKILEQYKITEIICVSAAALFGLGRVVEKRRSRQQIKINGALRHQLEHNDAFNGRSGLDDYGNAKEDKED